MVLLCLWTFFLLKSIALIAKSEADIQNLSTNSKSWPLDTSLDNFQCNIFTFSSFQASIAHNQRINQDFQIILHSL